MKTKLDFYRILRAVDYPGFTFLVSEEAEGGGLYLQIAATTPCNVTGEPLHWKGRKWRLSRHMTKSEVVQTAFKAVLTAIEHEAREQFTYRGQSIFDPHYDVDLLVDLRRREDCLDEREAPEAQKEDAA